MSKYTTEVRFLCESLTGHTESVGFNETDSIITAAAPIIFSFNFPIFDPDYKLPLEKKILRHYYTREISEETYGLWKLRLEDRMNVIMPYYNQLYQSALLTFNPFYDVDLTTEHAGNENGVVNSEEYDNRNREFNRNNEINENIDEVVNKNGNNYEKGSEIRTKEGDNDNVKIMSGDTTLTHTGTVDENENKSHNISNTGNENTSENTNKDNTQWDLFSDTPQGGINGLTVPNSSAPSTDLENNLYLSTARKITDNGNTNANRNSNTDNIEVGEESGQNNKTYNESNNENRNESENNISSFSENGENRKDNESGFEEFNINNIGRNSSETGDENESINSNRGDSKVSTSTEEYLQRVSGKSGGMTYSAMLMEYRETFINIDEMIIEELSDLFFGLW